MSPTCEPTINSIARTRPERLTVPGLPGARRVAALVLVIGAGLSGCSGPGADQEGAATPTQAASPTTTAAPPEPSSSPTDEPLHLAQHWRDHPGEQPLALWGASVLVDQRWTGPKTFTDLDLSGQEMVTVHVTCDQNVPYRVDLGTADDPEKTFYGGTGCGDGTIASGGFPMAEEGPLTQATVDLPEGVTYYLTVYGTPPTVDGTTGPDPSAP